MITNPKQKLFVSSRTWIEDNAIQQFRRTAELPGIVKAAGMPELHAGNGAPIGAAFLGEGIIDSHLIGSDIGCGMGLYSTSLQAGKSRVDRWAKKLSSCKTTLFSLDGPGDRELAARWTGSIQWIGSSAYRPGHKRCIWFVGIFPVEPVSEKAISGGEIRIETMRASGSGGQHLNKTDSAVRVSHWVKALLSYQHTPTIGAFGQFHWISCQYRGSVSCLRFT